MIKPKSLLLSLALPLLLIATPTVQAATPTEINTLIEQLDSDDFEERWDSSKALVDIGAEAVPALIEVLETERPDSFQWWLAVKTLEAIGAEAKAAIPILTEILDNRESFDSVIIVRVASAVTS